MPEHEKWNTLDLGRENCSATELGGGIQVTISAEQGWKVSGDLKGRIICLNLKPGIPIKKAQEIASIIEENCDSVTLGTTGQ